MVITSVVVGIAFSVLNLVQKQIKKGSEYFEDKTDLRLFEQQLSKDLNTTSLAIYAPKVSSLILKQDSIDINYTFEKEYTLRNNDTLEVQLQLKQLYFEGQEVNSGVCDALLLEAKKIPNYDIFISFIQFFFNVV